MNWAEFYSTDEGRYRLVQNLKYGLLAPCGNVYWSALFTELTKSQLKELERRVKAHAKETDRYFSSDNYYHLGNATDPKLFHKYRLIEYALQHKTKFDWPNPDRSSGLCDELPIVDVGRCDSRAYTNFAVACSSLLELQLYGKTCTHNYDPRLETDCRRLAQPKLLRSHLHKYIAMLIRVSITVDSLAPRSRRTGAFCGNGWILREGEEQAMRALALTKDELTAVAQSPPAILFTQSISKCKAPNPFEYPV